MGRNHEEVVQEVVKDCRSSRTGRTREPERARRRSRGTSRRLASGRVLPLKRDLDHHAHEAHRGRTQAREHVGAIVGIVERAAVRSSSIVIGPKNSWPVTAAAQRRSSSRRQSSPSTGYRARRVSVCAQGSAATRVRPWSCLLLGRSSTRHLSPPSLLARSPFSERKASRISGSSADPTGRHEGAKRTTPPPREQCATNATSTPNAKPC